MPFFPPFLATENLQNHFLFKFLIFNFSLWVIPAWSRTWGNARHIPTPASLAGRNQPRTREKRTRLVWKFWNGPKTRTRLVCSKSRSWPGQNAHIDFDTCEKNWLAMEEMGVILFNVAMTPISPISYVVELHCRHQNNHQTDFTETSIEVNFSIETLAT